MTIPALIKHYRYGLTLRAFSLKIGIVSHATIHQWEMGITEPSDEHITMLINHPESWIQELGRALFLARHGQTLKTLIKERNE